MAKSVFFYEGIGLARNPGPGNTENSVCFAIGAKNMDFSKMPKKKDSIGE
jgi:hypothetical protein